MKLDISKNGLRAAGGKTLAEGLRNNRVITELNIAGNWLGHGVSLTSTDLSGVVAIRNAVPTMWALAKLVFGGNAYYDRVQRKDVTPEPAVLEVGMTEADLGNKDLTVQGALLVGAWVAHKDNGALLTRLNLCQNRLLTKEGGAILGDMLKATPTLEELDVSGSGEGMYDFERDREGFAAGLAAGISANGTLTSLDLSRDDLRAEGAKHLAEALKVNVSVCCGSIGTILSSI